MPVAGLPLLVRTILRHDARTTGLPAGDLVLAVPGGALPDGWLREEMDRIFPQRTFQIVDSDDREALLNSGDSFAAGETCLGDGWPAHRSGLHSPKDAATGVISAHPDEVLAFHQGVSEAEIGALARAAGHAVLQTMGKPTDGLVSRYLNRSVSTRISQAVLKLRWFRPGHGTILTALSGIVMFACLIAGGTTGLIAGAVLFQLASIVDGVDGEVARATLRSTPRGAMLDSVTDAMTNLAFLLGLAVNLHLQGNGQALALGLVAFSCLAVGMALLGGHAVLSGRPVNFDSGKGFLQQRPARWKQALIWIFMRDFFAFAAMVMVIVGFAPALLAIFAVGSAGWLVFVFIALAKMQAPRASAGR